MKAICEIAGAEKRHYEEQVLSRGRSGGVQTRKQRKERELGRNKCLFSPKEAILYPNMGQVPLREESMKAICEIAGAEKRHYEEQVLSRGRSGGVQTRKQRKERELGRNKCLFSPKEAILYPNMGQVPLREESMKAICEIAGAEKRHYEEQVLYIERCVQEKLKILKSEKFEKWIFC